MILLGVEELLELEEALRDELNENLTAILTRLNRTGQLVDLLALLGLVSLFGVKRIDRIHSILDKMIFKKFCAMAALFGVSKSALAIRLQKKGLLGEYIFAGYESLLDIFPDTAA